MSPKNLDEAAILHAAAEEFSEKGYSGARVDAIAKRAGINKAMLYYRVGDKKELYRRVVLRGQQGFRDAMMKAMESTDTAPEAVVSILAGFAENAAESRLMPSIVLREIAGSARTFSEEALQGIRGFMKTVSAMVTMGIEEGSFRNIDPVTLQFIIAGAVFTLTLSAEMRHLMNPENPGPITPDQIAKAVGDIISHGILKEGTEQ